VGHASCTIPPASSILIAVRWRKTLISSLLSSHVVICRGFVDAKAC
jgi:hypothetical protein